MADSGRAKPKSAPTAPGFDQIPKRLADESVAEVQASASRIASTVGIPEQEALAAAWAQFRDAKLKTLGTPTGKGGRKRMTKADRAYRSWLNSRVHEASMNLGPHRSAALGQARTQAARGLGTVLASDAFSDFPDKGAFTESVLASISQARSPSEVSTVYGDAVKRLMEYRVSQSASEAARRGPGMSPGERTLETEEAKLIAERRESEAKYRPGSPEMVTAVNVYVEAVAEVGARKKREYEEDVRSKQEAYENERAAYEQKKAQPDEWNMKQLVKPEEPKIVPWEEHKESLLTEVLQEALGLARQRTGLRALTFGDLKAHRDSTGD